MKHFLISVFLLASCMETDTTNNEIKLADTKTNNIKNVYLEKGIIKPTSFTPNIEYVAQITDMTNPELKRIVVLAKSKKGNIDIDRVSEQESFFEIIDGKITRSHFDGFAEPRIPSFVLRDDTYSTIYETTLPAYFLENESYGIAVGIRFPGDKNDTRIFVKFSEEVELSYPTLPIVTAPVILSDDTVQLLDEVFQKRKATVETQEDVSKE